MINLAQSVAHPLLLDPINGRSKLLVLRRIKGIQGNASIAGHAGGRLLQFPLTTRTNWRFVRRAGNRWHVLLAISAPHEYDLREERKDPSISIGPRGW
jgi:hypothetical protein